MRTSAITLAFCGSLLALPVSAAQWVKITDSKVSAIYVDTASIKRTGDIVSAWYRRDFKRPMPSEKKLPYLSSRVLNYYNCATREVAAAQWITYEKPGGEGKKVSSDRVEPLAYGDIPLGEAGIDVYNFVCQPGKATK